MTPTSAQTPLDVAVVVPVYNEAECIGAVVQSWLTMLDGQGLRFCLIVLDDGSTDATRRVLETFAGDPRVEVIEKPNSGHGPTILLGYRRAVALGAWVFQVDSDDEVSAGEFPALWRERAGRDAVFGVRTARRQPATRWIITRVSRLLVWLLYGAGVEDVNVPFRLMRSDVLGSFVREIPDDVFAPNVVIAGVFSRSGFSLANIPVTSRNRLTGRSSIVRCTLLKAAVRSAVQTIRCRRLLAVSSASARSAAGHESANAS